MSWRRISKVDFFSACDGAGEEEVGDIRACDEHHARDDTPEEDERGLEARAERVLQERNRSDGRAEEHSGMSRGDAGLDGVHFGCGLVERDVGFQAANDAQPMAIAFAGDSIPTGGEPQVGFLREFETTRHHADDCVIAASVGIDGD